MGRESATKRVKVGVFLRTYKTEIEPLNHPTQNLQSRTVSLQSILLYVGHEIKQQTRKIDSEQYLVNSFASLYV